MPPVLLAPVSGSADGMRAVADAVEATGRRLADAAQTLGRMRDGAVWDGPAGDAFSARVGLAPAVLDRAAQRFLGAAGPMRAYATVFEHEQAVAQRAVLVHREAWEVYGHLEDRGVTLLASGLDESSPAVQVVRRAQQDEVASAWRAEAEHRAALDALAAADARCAALLTALADDDIADTAVYRALRTTSGVGHGVGYLASAPSRLYPQAAAVGAVGEGIGTLAGGALLVGYDEGSWRDVGVGTGTFALGFAGHSARAGAKANTVLRADGTVAYWAATTDRRLVEGALITARKRLTDARARFSAVPERGTPSHLVGGPPAPPAGPLVPRLRASAREAVHRQVGRGITELRLVTAGGPRTVRLYAAGVTLGTASRAVPHVVPSEQPPAPTSPTTLRPTDAEGTRRSTR
ncbi:hypothetical protein [Phycicoccus avicenniae]|uniref:hypothetical protein n=1 Tax=Phycicoccus avicenniae TaxID=2828860 RepID=UPI003D273983